MQGQLKDLFASLPSAVSNATPSPWLKELQGWKFWGVEVPGLEPIPGVAKGRRVQCSEVEVRAIYQRILFLSDYGKNKDFMFQQKLP